MRWDGIKFSMQTEFKFNRFRSISRMNKNTINVFAIASITMKILDAKYEA
jgi:hypothetical protein